MSWLCCVEGPDRGLQMEMGDQVVTIGRSPENTVRLAEEKASRFHCQLAFADGHLEVQDLNSTNGTLFGSDKVRGQKHSLRLGDQFCIGKDVFEFRRGPDRTVVSSLKTEESAPTIPLERGQEQTKYETANELQVHRKSWFKSLLRFGR